MKAKRSTKRIMQQREVDRYTGRKYSSEFGEGVCQKRTHNPPGFTIVRQK